VRGFSLAITFSPAITRQPCQPDYDLRSIEHGTMMTGEVMAAMTRAAPTACRRAACSASWPTRRRGRVPGGPIADIHEMTKVSLVMKGGKVQGDDASR